MPVINEWEELPRAMHSAFPGLLDALGLDSWDSFAAWAAEPLGEKKAYAMLSHLLVEAPIPAGCEALLVAMRSGAPWQEHEVLEDRAWLWFAHWLLHRASPLLYGEPTLDRLRVAADPERRPRRWRPRQLLLLAADQLHSDDPGWPFETLWGVRVISDASPMELEVLALPGVVSPR